MLRRKKPKQAKSGDLGTEESSPQRRHLVSGEEVGGQALGTVDGLADQAGQQTQGTVKRPEYRVHRGRKETGGSL